MITVYIATSLDGFIARKDGSIDWLHDIENPSREDYGYADFINGIDAIVMGRGTFETVLAFPSWPYRQKVFVLSTTRKNLPAKLVKKAELLSMTPEDVVAYLSKEGYSNIYVDGGRTIQGFLRADLIDRLIITRIPLLIGAGIPLFGLLDRDIHFRHVETKVYPNGLVKSSYERERK